MNDPFATAGELAQLIGAEEPADLARMQMFLGLASAEIRAHTGQVLSPVSGDVVSLEPRFSQVVFLPERPVTAITQVLVDAVATTDYRFTAGGHLIRGSDPTVVSLLDWSDGATVTYTHGYAETTDEYQVIKAVCLECASNGYTLNEGGSSAVLGGPTLLESAGFAPAVFLTAEQKRRLDQLASRPVAVG